MKKDYLVNRPTVVCDTECYRDYWSIGFKNIANGKKVIYELYEGHPLDRAKIAHIVKNFRIITFNGIHYDQHMIALAMSGASNATLKRANDDIFAGLRPWQFADRYDAVMPSYFDHIDIYDVAPGVRLSLKKYGARLNAPRLQELPIDPTELIGAARRPLMRSYLGNDLDTTHLLVDAIKPEMELRAEMSAKHGIDLRSKSDAQIAEALIKLEVEKRTGRILKKPTIAPGSFHYKPPTWLRFKTKAMQDLLVEIMNIKFLIGRDGRCPLPKSLEGRVVKIDGMGYKMGIGGLHSQEKSTYHVADKETTLLDRDVKGYYPILMINCGFVPDEVGPIFTHIFRQFVRNRDKAKALIKRFKAKGLKDLQMKYTAVSGGLKIVNNGTFGKAGSPFSVLWGPKMMIHVTLTGQLALLMLIERLAMAEFRVVSANTDGVVTAVPRQRTYEFDCLIFDEWEAPSGMVTEEVEYKALYSRSVNSYFAIKSDGSVKTKGQYSPASVKAGEAHDPAGDICSTAAIAWVKDRVPIEKTIRECLDITKFIFVKMTEDGGFKNGEYLGKLVRWYHGIGERTGIQKANGDQVAGSMGAYPCMDLPEKFPDNVDLAWYIRESYARVADTGLSGANPHAPKRVGYKYATLPKRSTVHIIDLATSTSICGKRTEDVREPWEEHDHAEKVCKTCREAGVDIGEEEEF